MLFVMGKCELIKMLHFIVQSVLSLTVYFCKLAKLITFLKNIISIYSKIHVYVSRYSTKSSQIVGKHKRTSHGDNDKL